MGISIVEMMISAQTADMIALNTDFSMDGMDS